MVLTQTSRALLRTAPRTAQAVRALSTTTAKKADNTAAPAFQSPFKVPGETTETTRIPDFSHYRSKRGSSNNNLLFQYFMVGTMGALTAAGAKSTVQGMWTVVEGQEWDERVPMGITIDGNGRGDGKMAKGS
jgi:ubiquinol-cytochrome c reductase iron-sulfur subunit